MPCNSCQRRNNQAQQLNVTSNSNNATPNGNQNHSNNAADATPSINPAYIDPSNSSSRSSFNPSTMAVKKCPAHSAVNLAGATETSGAGPEDSRSSNSSSSSKTEGINSSFDPRDYAQGNDAMSTMAEKAMMGFVSQLTEDNFESSIRSNLTFIKFYVPWCGHCTRLKPVWEDLAYKAEGGNFKIAEVDCSKNGKVCDAQGLDGYPSLILFKDGKKVGEYSGKRTSSEMLAFVQKHNS